MTLLPTIEVYKLVKQGELIIEPFDSREERTPPATVDLTLGGKVLRYNFPEETYILGEEIPEEYQVYKEIKDVIEFKPKESIIIPIYEKLVLPSYIAGIILPRSSITRLGLSFQATYINPGYQGNCPILLTNQSEFTIKIPLKNGRSPRIAQILFLSLTKEPHRIYGEGLDEKYQDDKGYHSKIYQDIDIHEIFQPLLEIGRKYGL
ncbi:MAG: dCTP deaminase [Candidatus Desulfofervidus auxilii]|nr:dCTP deaminase [Candidatus Desulfofervidus auxilii]